MSQVFSEDGATVPVTVIEAEPSLVIQKKTKETDGYDAVQLASGLTWQESIGQEVLLGTFDGQLWEAAPGAGLRVWPEKLAK